MITKRKNNAVEIAKSSLGGGIGLLDSKPLEKAVNDWSLQYVNLESGLNITADDWSKEYDLTDFLPIDNNRYEVALDVYGNSGLSPDGSIFGIILTGYNTQQFGFKTQNITASRRGNGVGSVILEIDENRKFTAFCTGSHNLSEEYSAMLWINLISYRKLK